MRVLIGYQAEVDLGPRRVGEHRLDPRPAVPATHAADRTGRLKEVFFEQGSAFQSQDKVWETQIARAFGRVEGNGVEDVKVPGTGQAHRVVETGDLNAFVRGFQLAQGPREPPHRVGCDRSPHRVQVGPRADDPYLDVADALYAAIDGSDGRCCP